MPTLLVLAARATWTFLPISRPSFCSSWGWTRYGFTVQGDTLVYATERGYIHQCEMGKKPYLHCTKSKSTEGAPAALGSRRRGAFRRLVVCGCAHPECLMCETIKSLTFAPFIIKINISISAFVQYFKSMRCIKEVEGNAGKTWHDSNCPKHFPTRLFPSSFLGTGQGGKQKRGGGAAGARKDAASARVWSKCSGGHPPSLLSFSTRKVPALGVPWCGTPAASCCLQEMAEVHL